jgi:hypothetical protein
VGYYFNLSLTKEAAGSDPFSTAEYPIYLG